VTGLYLGVDAGNSKTVAVVCDAAGRVAGYGRGGNGDIYGAPSPPAAVDAVLTAVTAAATAAGLPPSPGAAGPAPGSLAGTAFRLAGVDWPEDERFWRDVAAERLPGLGPLSVANDGYAAIRCGDPAGTGVAVVCGTGAALAGRGPTGRTHHLSFWLRHPLGATDLVREALDAVYLAELGLGPATALTAALLTHFGRTGVEDLLHHLTRRDGAAARRAKPAAARAVTAAASAGDPVALRIVTAQGDRLADYARVTASRVGFAATDPVPVVLAGSVLSAPRSPVAGAFLAALPRRLPAALPRRPAIPPACGAALDAVAEAGIRVTPAILDRIRATAPPPDILQT
jgi:N-acetylglucosamine kinase-like BadF-type ATPase